MCDHVKYLYSYQIVTEVNLRAADQTAELWPMTPKWPILYTMRVTHLQWATLPPRE